jgi:septum site-determining protein MinD
VEKLPFKVVIHSFKGGPGKSTITANLATSLALKGKSVGMMDLDLAGPGLHVIFELNKEEIKHTLNDVFLMKCSPTDTVIDLTERLGLEKGSLMFIPASYKAEDIVRILSKGYELSMFQTAVEEVSKTYNLDYIFIDTHPGIEESTLVAIGTGDVILLISRIDSQDVFGTGVILEVSKALKKSVFLVMNMIPPGTEYEILNERLQNTFNTPVIGKIPFYTEILRSLSAGVFILKNPEHEFTSMINSLTFKLLEVEKNGY